MRADGGPLVQRPILRAGDRHFAGAPANHRTMAGCDLARIVDVSRRQEVRVPALTSTETPNAQRLSAGAFSLSPQRAISGVTVTPCTNTDAAMTANVRLTTWSLNGAGSPWTIAYAR